MLSYLIPLIIFCLSQLYLSILFSIFQGVFFLSDSFSQQCTNYVFWILQAYRPLYFFISVGFYDIRFLILVFSYSSLGLFYSSNNFFQYFPLKKTRSLFLSVFRIDPIPYDITKGRIKVVFSCLFLQIS